ncbi:MAG: carbohydrate kinase [Cyclobacteriaceae bacterium]
MKALVFGEILWDIIEGEHHLGGAPLNFAAHVKQCGQTSCIVSCLGNDQLGDEAYRLVKGLSVDVSMIQRANIRTGFVPVTLKDGQPDYVITKDVAYDYIESGQLDHPSIPEFDFFYFGSLIQRNQVSRDALYNILERHQFEEIFYDVNLRKDSYDKEIIKQSLKHCTILKVNDEEVGVLSKMLFGEKQDFETFGQAICDQYDQIKTIIITAGGEGCYVYHEGNITRIPTEKIKVIDTVGAGDSFSAAFVCVYYQTGDPLKAATIANKVGGFVASSRGPIPSYPPELKELLKQG